MDFVLTLIDAQHMTFIEMCKAEIEKTKIWLLLGYFFLQKWQFFLEKDWFELWICCASDDITTESIPQTKHSLKKISHFCKKIAQK